MRGKAAWIIAAALWAGGAGTATAVQQPPGAAKNVELVANLPEGRYATAINFLSYGHGRRATEVMLITGRFGLKSYDISTPSAPRLLDEVTSEELHLPGDPPVKMDPPDQSTYWQNEDMDVDRSRKLAILSRDPRSYRGSTSREPGEEDPNGATNIAGVYVVDAKDPRDLRLLSFTQLPTGHTSSCIDGCRYLWTGGPASTVHQREDLGWALGRPIIVTDLRDPAHPVAHPDEPLDLFRADGTTAYSHDVQVDDAGIAWVSGLGGVRGYWTSGRHADPVSGERREATPLDPIPYGGGGFADDAVGDTPGGWMHNSARPVGPRAPKGDKRYKRGELLLATEEDFGPPEEACRDRGAFTIASLDGSYGGEGWRSTPEQPFRLRTVGRWSPYAQEGTRTEGLTFCSAHYFDVDGPLVTYAWYGQGTRFLDVSRPEQPIQVAYWRPDDGNVWASYLHDGYVYTADHGRGIDVLRLKTGAHAAAARRREVVAPPMSLRQVAYLRGLSRQLRPDPSTGYLCLLPVAR
ncbi:MAG: hypothetical protein HZB46_13040 [Solirubrobacterales bacterium]|nr:hypothetical protein [Solirubrobacterales bacterium]